MMHLRHHHHHHQLLPVFRHQLKITDFFLTLSLLFTLLSSSRVECISPSSSSVSLPNQKSTTMLRKSVEKQLVRNLLNRYKQFGIVGRPVENSATRLLVQYSLQLVQILDLDENKQILRTNCWSLYKWKDTLLRWNPANYTNIKKIRIFPDQVWTPDIKLYNFADERLREHREARVVVSHDGSVLWNPQALFKSTCSVEILYFPFDFQICKMEFGSWTYDLNQLDITWILLGNNTDIPNPYIDFNEYLASNEWRTDGEREKNLWPHEKKFQIKSVKKYRPRTHYNSLGQRIVRTYPRLQYRVRLHRNPLFFVSILVIPCVLLSSLTLVVFWLPPESPAKLQLGMNIFVAFFILLLLLEESTPSAAKNFPLIGAYFCLNMIMVTLSTFLATMVTNFYFRGDRNGPVPNWIRRFIVEGLGRLLMVRQHIPLPQPSKFQPAPAKMSGGTAAMQAGVGAGGERRPGGISGASQHQMVKIKSTRGRRSFRSRDVAVSVLRGASIRSGGGTGGGGGGGAGQGASAGGGGPILYKLTVPSLNESNKFLTSDLAASNNLHCAVAPPFSGAAPPSAPPHFGRQTSGGMEGTHPVNTPASALPAGVTGPPPLMDTQDSPLLMHCHTNLEREVRLMKRAIRQYVLRQQQDSRLNFISMEWRTTALVLDRLFFVLYISVIFIAVVSAFPKSRSLSGKPEDTDDID